jgi:hypothetical protein
MEVASRFEKSSGNPDVLTQKSKFSNYYRHENPNLKVKSKFEILNKCKPVIRVNTGEEGKSVSLADIFHELWQPLRANIPS